MKLVTHQSRSSPPWIGSLLLLATSFALPVAALGAEAATTEPAKMERLEIVDRAIGFHGGQTYSSSHTSLTICSKSGCFDLKATVQGDIFGYEVEDPKRRVRSTNDAVVRFENGKSVELDAEAAQRNRDFVNARIYFAFLPYRLNDASVFKQDLGLEKWGDLYLHKVKVTFAAGSSTDSGDAYLYWFDPATARLEQFAYSYGTGEGAGIRFRKLKNYRRIGGLLFFDQQNLGYEAPDVGVDIITPAFVEDKMREVSNVVLSKIEVREVFIGDIDGGQ